MTTPTARHQNVSGAIIVYKPSGQRGMKWQCDQRNWCIFGSHKDCDIQIRSEGVAEMQALVLLDSHCFSLEQLADNANTVVPGIGALHKGQKVFLQSGNQFFIAKRHFGTEITLSPAAGGRQDKPTPAKRDTNSPSCAAIRRTSLVLAREGNMFIVASTNTKLFPSSVLETPSEKVSALLQNETSRHSSEKKTEGQGLTRRINLPDPSESDEGELLTDPEESEDESLESTENIVHDVESVKSKDNPNTPANEISNHKAQQKVRSVGGATRSFSRWPRSNGNPITSQVLEHKPIRNRLQSEENHITQGSSTNNPVNLRRETAFDRLSRGLPSTPMRWEGRNLKNAEKIQSAGRPGSRSVLFSNAELGQGPHYSPVPVKSKSRIPMRESENCTPNTIAIPSGSPKSKLSEEKVSFGQKQGPPPSTRLQQLGKFFYPAAQGSNVGRNAPEKHSSMDDGKTYSHFEPDRVLTPERNVSANYISSRSSLESSAEDNCFTASSGTGGSKRRLNQNPLSSFSLESSAQSSSSSEDSNEEYNIASMPRVPHPLSSGTPNLAVQNSVDDGLSEKNGDEVEISSSPWRRSLFGAVLGAAKAVTDRFSIGGASSKESPVTCGPVTLDFDPEDLDTASESEGTIDCGDEESESLSTGSTANESTECPLREAEVLNDSTGHLAPQAREIEIPVSSSTNSADLETSITNMNEDEQTSPRGAPTIASGMGEESSEKPEEMEKFRQMNYFVLKKNLKSFGLDTSGKKDTLIERLEKHMSTKNSIASSNVEVCETPTENEADKKAIEGPKLVTKTQSREVDGSENTFLSETMDRLERVEESGPSTTREDYESRTVKEIRQFMKQHQIEVPPRIKKAELIDLVIAHGLDSNGNLVADPHADSSGKGHKTSLETTQTPFTPTKGGDDRVVPEIDLITPVRKSSRRKASTTCVLPTDDIKEVEPLPTKGRSSAKGETHGAANENSSVRHASRTGSIKKKAHKDPPPQATPVRRSARKRNPVPRFEE
ncbi:unnamed protein product [Chondrus crispus]|uniref:SAP domain-containing protein n=1 Tax=Chondrus crispus TaxID=2769 RepID=R7Q3U7_CHOCR|nr:unnamed protein product [Chondrus crispus]CDF32533.1 unnamed protein product [Chondrus crispus]|eukprot:XP_005712198.1 unnamed protein product [Chondrus crispus]